MKPGNHTEGRALAVMMPAWLTLVAFVALMAFAVTSHAQEAQIQASGEAELQWIPPTQNVDGSELTDLAGYRILWGRASREYTDSLPINEPERTTATIILTVDQEVTVFYIAMTSLDTSGNESGYSNEITRTITVDITDDTPPNPPQLQTIEFTVDGCVVVNNPSATCTVVFE